MAFDLTHWRAETRQQIEDFARDPRSALGRAGVDTVYGFLLGSAILPVAAAYAADPAGVVAALIGVLGGLGANLIANLAQRAYDQNTIAVVSAEAQRDELAQAYAAIAQQLDLVPLAERALAQARQTAILDQLRDELRRLGQAGPFAGATIVQHQSGGLNLGVGSSIGQIGTINLHEPPSQAATPRSGQTTPAFLQSLIDRHTERLRVLELQAARTGFSAPPEVVNEIEHIRGEIARLQAQLGS